MFKIILFVALVVVVVQCARPAIPINKQGKDFPVPTADEKVTDDYFDDRFYPDIDDEKIGVRKDNGQGSKGGSASQSRPPAPDKSPGKTNVSDKRADPPKASPCDRKSGRKGVRDRTKNRELVIDESTARVRQNSQDRKQNHKQNRPVQRNLQSYKDAPATYVFKSYDFRENGRTPIVKLFETNKAEEVIAKGGRNDEYVLDILDGKPYKLSLKMDATGTVTVSNPDRERIVGRLKTYKA
uniref:25 kDa salivary protein SP06 n=1 Tax=Phlebotomus argentipes TaxID=94469 RepID=Q0ZSU3_PHLAR|nr:25 kDA salivary protein SP06 [Phlebotomus argentipes]